MKRLLWTGVVSVAVTLSARGAVVFSDNFNRANLNGGSHSYTTTVTAGDGAASIAGSDTLELTNDGSTTDNGVGRVFVTTTTSGFSGPYASQLDQNAGLVSWTFNMQQIRSNPSGFNSGAYGVAFVIGATSADLTTASGYAVVLGQSGDSDPVRLARFSDGLDLDSQFHDIVTASSVLTDVGAEHLSLRVTYDPSDNGWALYGRDDGTTFADPAAGSLSSLGASTDSTHTGQELSYLGMWWGYNSAQDQTARFDNISVTAVPEPATDGLLSALGLLGVAGIHSWSRRARETAARHAA